MQLRRTVGKIKNRPLTIANVRSSKGNPVDDRTTNNNPFFNSDKTVTITNNNPFDNLDSITKADDIDCIGNVQIEDSEERYQYLCVEERVNNIRDNGQHEEDDERGESPLPIYDIKTFADHVRTARKLVKRNVRDYVVAVTGKYDAEEEDVKYEKRKVKKQRRAKAKQEFREAMQRDDPENTQCTKTRRTIADKINPFKKKHSSLDKEKPSQGARIFDKEKLDRKQAYANKLQRYKDDKQKELTEKSECHMKPEPEVEYSYKLKMVTYTPEQAARDISTHWTVTSYSDNIITLVNADESLDCRTLSLNNGYKVNKKYYQQYHVICK